MKRVYYTKNELSRSYEKLVQKACYYQRCGNISRAREIIERAAKLQYNLNVIYSDSRLTNILKEESYKRYGKIDNYQGKDDTVVFYDDLSVDNGGLTQQYLDALLSYKDVKVVYVSGTSIARRGEHILQKLQDYDVCYYELNKNATIAEDELKEILERHKPQKLFLHLLPYSTTPFVVGYAFPGLLKYQINITDHAFWLGSPDYFDKIIEFRDYGAQVSIEKRGFRSQQIILLPFYPWQEKTEFQGFPDIKQPLILFSGGATYKIAGGGNVFFSMVDKILDKNCNIAFLFAGSGNTEQIEDFKRNSKNSDRILYLGFRQDIAEVMKHIDIYINTYPLGGGLMLQLAAINRKPILALNDNSCESLVCTKKKANFAFDNVDDLVNEANRLFSDDSYRYERAEFFHSLVATRDDFIEGLYNKCFSTVSPGETIKKVEIDYDSFSDVYLNSINNGHLELFVEQNILRAHPFALNWKMIINCILGGFSFLKHNLKKH